MRSRHPMDQASPSASQLLQSLPKQIRTPPRMSTQLGLSAQHQGLGLGASDGITWVRRDRQPKPTVGRTVHTHHRRLISQVNAITHVAEGSTRVRGAAIGDRTASQITVHDDFAAVSPGQHDLAVDDGLADRFQDLHNLLCLARRQPGQCAADTAIVCPSWLCPGPGYFLILIQRVS
jgi:hypothetical protein